MFSRSARDYRKTNYIFLKTNFQTKLSNVKYVINNICVITFYTFSRKITGTRISFHILFFLIVNSFFFHLSNSLLINIVNILIYHHVCGNKLKNINIFVYIYYYNNVINSKPILSFHISNNSYNSFEIKYNIVFFF